MEMSDTRSDESCRRFSVDDVPIGEVGCMRVLYIHSSFHRLKVSCKYGQEHSCNPEQIG